MKFIVYVVAAIALLGGLFVVFRPEPVKETASQGSVVSSAPLSAPPPAPSAPVAGSGATLPERKDAGPDVELVIEHGRLVSGPSVVRIKQNDPLVFHVTSDTADELHLHGYNLHLALKPGKTATLEVQTTRVGRFTYELHHRDVEIGALEVYPR